MRGSRPHSWKHSPDTRFACCCRHPWLTRGQAALPENPKCRRLQHARGESGFSLAEFTISSLILLTISVSVFSMLGETQRTASYQTEVQGVLENSRIAMDTVQRYLRQAGNDPRNAGFQGLAITSASEIRVRSDLTGSASGYPDKGDPDGDTNDSGEDVVIRFNSTARSIEVVPNGGTAQTIANYIAGLQMNFFDASGSATTSGPDTRRVRISLTAATTVPNPQTRAVFSMQLTGEVQLATRQ